MKSPFYSPLVKTILGVLIVVAMATSAYAQSTPAPTRPVTDDDVNSIAHKLYCPVCENITLDTCETAACADWRNEISIQLQEGRTEDQIISDFVQRFGDRVVGTPQDTALRLLSLATPWIIIVIILVIMARFIMARTRSRAAPAAVPPDGSAASAPPDASMQKYREMLEKDLKE